MDLVETFVIYTGAKDRQVEVPADTLQLLFLRIESLLSCLANKIHLVYKKEDGGFRAKLPQPFEAVSIVVQVFIHLAALHVENIDEDPNVLEDGCSLGGEITVHECILAAAVPQIEDEVPQETNMVLLNVNGSTESRGEGSRIIRAGKKKGTEFWTITKDELDPQND